MDPPLILVIVMGLSVLVFVAFAILMFTTVAASPSVVIEENDSEAHEKQADARPWWVRPQAWLVIALLFLFIGLFVTPKIFGFTFFFLPFFWLRGPRARQRRKPPPPSND